MSKVTAKDLETFFESLFPDKSQHHPKYSKVEKDFAQLKLQITQQHLRPGGYISGPTQMALADHAAYVAIFTRTGIVPMAVTSNLNIDFLRPCIGTTLVADARMIKLGRNLAVVGVDMYTEGADKIASRATVTYVIPAK